MTESDHTSRVPADASSARLPRMSETLANAVKDWNRQTARLNGALDGVTEQLAEARKTMESELMPAAKTAREIMSVLKPIFRR